MLPEYNLYDKVGPLSRILEEYSEWFGRVLRLTYYPDSFDDEETELVYPGLFQKWCGEAKDQGWIQPQSLTRLSEINADLQKASELFLLESVSAKQNPPLELFDTFVNLYEAFLAELRRVEIDNVLEETGTDQQTGMRSAEVMLKDLEREMERRTRRGKPFSLILARMDQYPEMDETEKDSVMKAVSAAIKSALRSFDDAYRKRDDEFILCLKQAGSGGAKAAINRIRKNLSQGQSQEVGKEGNQETMPVAERPDISLSYCCVEPGPGENVKFILKNMEDELNRSNKGPDSITIVKDMSPLQRYIKDMKKK